MTETFLVLTKAAQQLLMEAKYLVCKGDIPHSGQNYKGEPVSYLRPFISLATAHINCTF